MKLSRGRIPISVAAVSLVAVVAVAVAVTEHHTGSPASTPAADHPSKTASDSPPATASRTPSAHHPGSATPSSRYPTEEAYNKHGVLTFADYLNASDAGRSLIFGERVKVACKIYSPTIPSASPGGYWYRIEGRPWDGRYYAIANTFLNGDPPGGPYTHNYDSRVHDC
jgi:hypothetical protein